MEKIFEVKTEIYKKGELIVKGSSYFEDSESLIVGMGKSFIPLTPKVLELYEKLKVKK